MRKLIVATLLIIGVLASFIALFIAIESGYFRDEESLLVEEKIRSQIHQGNYQIAADKLLKEDYPITCIIAPYGDSRPLLTEYFKNDFAARNGKIYSDNYWGLIFINPETQEFKDIDIHTASFYFPTNKEHCESTDKLILDFSNVANRRQR